MAYASRAQQGLFHSPNSPVSAKVVAEFDAASKGSHNLPYHVKHPSGNEPPIRYGEKPQAFSLSTSAKDYGH
jgi:hypothetical protein